MIENDMQELRKSIEELERKLKLTRSYRYVQVVAKSLSTDISRVDCDFIADKIIIENPAGGAIVHVAFSSAFDATNYFAIDAGDRLELEASSKSISVRAASGTPTIHIIFLAYEYQEA